MSVIRFALALLVAIPLLRAAEVRREIEYARVDSQSLALDLYTPEKQTGPLIVFVHGGAWRSGSKAEMPLGDLVTAGFPVATIDYRLSTVAKFPAQAHDIKGAIRFLRAQQGALKIDATRIVIAGTSAGGHLAALVGVTNGQRDLEGDTGGNVAQSSDVQGIMSFYGGSDLTTILAQSTPHGLSVRVPALDLLLGGQPDQKPALARLASPVFHIDKYDPPLLLIHGDQDPQMPINQAHQLHGAYQKAGAKSEFKVIYGAGHGGKAFFDAERMVWIKEFLGQNVAK